MSYEEIFLTSALTIIGGVAVFVLGHIFLKFFIEPVHELLRVIGDVEDTLIFYANIYTNTNLPSDKYIETKNILRQKASLLKSRTRVAKGYRIFSIFGVPARDDINEAHSELIGLSNSIPPMNSSYCVANMERRKRIANLLRF